MSDEPVLRRENELRWAAHAELHAGLDKAVALQAIEYARRLEVLNHAHEQALAVAARVVSREVFDSFVRENEGRRAGLLSAIEQRIDSNEKQIEVERSARIRAEGVAGTWRGIAGFLGASGLVGTLLGIIAVFGPHQ